MKGPASKAATAAFRVLADLYPRQADTLQQHYDASLAAIPGGPAKTRGIGAGDAAAAAMLDAREGDGRLPAGTPYPLPPGTTPGAWRVSPPLTAVEPTWWLGNVRPSMIPGARWFVSDGPNPLTGRAYARGLNELKRIGELGSAFRTDDQTKAAIFWQAQPLALYGGVMRDLSARYGLSTAQNARLFGTATLAAADRDRVLERPLRPRLRHERGHERAAGALRPRPTCSAPASRASRGTSSGSSGRSSDGFVACTATKSSIYGSV